MIRPSKGAFLRGLWVCAYTLLVHLFNLLKCLERGGHKPSGRSAGKEGVGDAFDSGGGPIGTSQRSVAIQDVAAQHTWRRRLRVHGRLRFRLKWICVVTGVLSGSAVLVGRSAGQSLKPQAPPAAAATVSPGLPAGPGWHELPDTRLSDVCPPDSGGYSFSFHCQNVIAAWSGGIADTARNRLVLWGGGHNDYYGNELYSLDLNTRKLVRLNNPSPMNAYGGTCIRALSDGSPNSRHTYAGLAYIAHVDKMFAFGGSLACGSGSGGDDTWTLDLATLQWKRMDPARGGTPTPVNLAAVADYDPNTKKVYLHDRKTFWSYDYDTNTYAGLSEFPISVYSNAVIDPKRKLFFIMGKDDGGGPRLLAVNIASRGGHNPQDWTGKVRGCEALAGTDYPGLAYDSSLDRIVGWINEGHTGTVFLFDPDSKLCTTKAFPGGPPLSGKTRGTFGRWRYFPGLDVFAVVNDWQQDAYILLLTGSAAESTKSPESQTSQAPLSTDESEHGAAPASSGNQRLPSTLPANRNVATAPRAEAAQPQAAGPFASTLETSPPADSDFAARCLLPGVVRCYGFDDSVDAPQYLEQGGGETPKLGSIDASVKASGKGSLRFRIPSQSGEGDAGSFPINFSSDLSTRFGEGDEFYIQWRQRFSPEFLNTVYQDGEGWKQVIISSGDRPGHVARACTDLEIVVQNTKQRGFPQVYHSCGSKDGQYEALVVYRGGQYQLQNATKPPCLWDQERFPPCVGYKPNQWMTFQIHVKIGTWYKNDRRYHRDSAIQLWVAEEGKPSRLVIDFSPKSGDAGGYDLMNSDPADKYGKIWLTPYHTHKNSAQVHPVGYVWYDELIVSRNKIPDPGELTSGVKRKP